VSEVTFGNSALIAGILPPRTQYAELQGKLRGTLLAEESAMLTPRTVDGRREEFAAGRTCARFALQLLGLPVTPLLSGVAREPIWPKGVVGSITHCEGYCAAVTAFERDLLSVGIDAEPNRPLSEELVDLIAAPSELRDLPICPGCSIAWDRLLFSIKESVYKAWFPIERSWLDFKEAVVEIDAPTCRFSVSISRSSQSFPRNVSGRYVTTPDFLLTAVWVVG
jgi:4'-phosphopantetheinyl transferase EntD